MSYDREELLDDIKTLFEQYLPAKLTQIALEKNDSIVLAVPETYYLDLEDDQIKEQVYGTIRHYQSSEPAPGNSLLHGNVAVVEEIHVFINFTGIGYNSIGDNRRKAERYTRALTEVVMEHTKDTPFRFTTGLLAVPMTINDIYHPDKDTKAGGTRIMTTLTL